MAEIVDVAEMVVAIQAMQRCLVRLEADMEQLKAVTPEARFRMFKVLEVESDRRDVEFTHDR